MKGAKAGQDDGLLFSWLFVAVYRALGIQGSFQRLYLRENSDGGRRLRRCGHEQRHFLEKGEFYYTWKIYAKC